jgi:hypothetical protein
VNESRKISREIFGRCPKITTKHKRVPKTKYPSQRVTRVTREITGTVESYRYRRNTIRSSNEETADKVKIRTINFPRNFGPRATHKEHTVGLLTAALRQPITI